MSRVWDAVVLFSVMLGFVLLLLLAGGALIYAGRPQFVFVLFPIGGVYCLLLYGFVRYRTGRQEEFLHLLITTMEAKAPLVPALKAYARDRPQDTAREIWVGALLFVVLPGYYWVWHRQRNFDRKVEALAHLLEEGTSLYHGLLVTPGLVSGETLLAVAMGEVTGRTVLHLRATARSRLGALWAEMAPRLLYPLLVLLIVLGVNSFLRIYIIPKMDRIYRDFDMKLPWLTDAMIWMWEPLLTALMPVLFIIGTLGVVLLFSSAARWYFPVLGGLYRMHVRGLVLRMLGPLLEAGKPVPEALALLADSGFFSSTAEWRLDACRHLVGEGESLAGALYAVGLLPAGMVPLVQSAQRVGNLPWALGELGESLSNRCVRRLRQASMVVAPLLLLAISVLVASVAVGLFLPLIKIIEGLGV
jgi:protein transport protein HofC